MFDRISYYESVWECVFLLYFVLETRCKVLSFFSKNSSFVFLKNASIHFQKIGHHKSTALIVVCLHTHWSLFALSLCLQPTSLWEEIFDQ